MQELRKEDTCWWWNVLLFRTILWLRSWYQFLCFII